MEPGISGVGIISTGGTTCMTCGGLIAEPGKVYGWAGKWCHCIRPEKVCVPAPTPQMDFTAWIRLQEELTQALKLNHTQAVEIIVLTHKVKILTDALELVRNKHPDCFCMDHAAIADGALKEVGKV